MLRSSRMVVELLVEAGGVGFDAACAQGLHPAHPLLEEAQAALHVGLHLGTLGGAHGDEVIQRLSRHGGDVGQSCSSSTSAWRVASTSGKRVSVETVTSFLMQSFSERFRRAFW